MLLLAMNLLSFNCNCLTNRCVRLAIMCILLIIAHKGDVSPENLKPAKLFVRICMY